MKNQKLFSIWAVTFSVLFGLESESKPKASAIETLNKLNRTNQNRAVCQTTPTPVPNEDLLQAELPASKNGTWEWLNQMVINSLSNENLESKMEMQMEAGGEGVKGAYEYYLADLQYGKCRMKIDVIIRPSRSEDGLSHSGIAIKEFKSLEIVAKKDDCKGSDEECLVVVAEKRIKSDDYVELTKQNTQSTFMDPILNKRAEIDQRCKPAGK
jgi:hypothetical protein